MSSTNAQQGMRQMENTVLVRIDGRIGLPDKPSSWPIIFQVPHYLRKLNEDAYEPTIISIGPYHREKDHLKAMETHKERFLNDLRRRKENGAQRYVKAMTGMMERARDCYSQSLGISHEEFLEMMVLDGCFIVELLHKIADRSWLQDSILKMGQIYKSILNDLILVENQLPFFVLWEFLGNTFGDRSPYISVIIEMFKERMPGLKVPTTYNENSIKKVKHILDLLRTYWLPSEDSTNKCKNGQEDIKFIHSATKLREAGIKFRRGQGRNLFDIKFENGTLYIPHMRLEGYTGGLYCNIIASEQFDDSGSPKYLTGYVTVMDCLIDTGKDVELLCHKGIMEQWLGADEAAAKMFNRLGIEVILDKSNFFYTKLFNDVNRYYSKPWNKRMANLRHNYFNTPWALISVFAAAFLLVLAFLQTTFTIFPTS